MTRFAALSAALCALLLLPSVVLAQATLPEIPALTMTPTEGGGAQWSLSLQVLAAMVEADKPASQILRQFEPAPQILKNVRYKSGAPLEADEVKEAIRDAEAELGDSGRLVIRKSGTEPLIRIMAEGDDARKVEKIVDSLVETVGRAA